MGFLVLRENPRIGARLSPKCFLWCTQLQLLQPLVKLKFFAEILRVKDQHPLDVFGLHHRRSVAQPVPMRAGPLWFSPNFLAKFVGGYSDDRGPHLRMRIQAGDRGVPIPFGLLLPL